MAIKPVDIKTEAPDNRLENRSALELRMSALDDNAVILNWQAKASANTFGYKIEKLTEQDIFQSLGFIPAQPRSGAVKYSYINRPVTPGNLIYRLREIDADGATISLSKEFLHQFSPPSKIFKISSH